MTLDDFLNKCYTTCNGTQVCVAIFNSEDSMDNWVEDLYTGFTTKPIEWEVLAMYYSNYKPEVTFTEKLLNADVICFNAVKRDVYAVCIEFS